MTLSGSPSGGHADAGFSPPCGESSTPGGLAAPENLWRPPRVLRVKTCLSPGPEDYMRVSSFEASDRDEDGLLELVFDPGAIPAVGAGGRVETGFGPLPVTALADFLDAEETVDWFTGAAMALEIELEGGELSGRLGAAIGADAGAVVYRLVADFFDRQLQVGISDYARDELDANRDGRITADEVENDELLGSIFAFDVDLFAEEGRNAPVYWPNRDGSRDRISLAIELHAVRVAVE